MNGGVLIWIGVVVFDIQSSQFSIVELIEIGLIGRSHRDDSRIRNASRESISSAPAVICGLGGQYWTRTLLAKFVKATGGLVVGDNFFAAFDCEWLVRPRVFLN